MPNDINNIDSESLKQNNAATETGDSLPVTNKQDEQIFETTSQAEETNGEERSQRVLDKEEDPEDDAVVEKEGA